MNKNFKVLLAVIYVLCLAVSLFVVFSYFDLKDLSSYSFIKENSKILTDYKKEHIIVLTLAFFTFYVLWVLFLGFGSPIAMLAGFIFGQWTGTFISVLSFTVGSSLLYVLAKYYFAESIKKHLTKKIESYSSLFTKNEFLYFMIFRLTGGAGIPFAIQNILPVIFNMKLKNYIPATFLGLIPTIFIFNSLGSGMSSLIEKNDDMNYLEIIFEPGIYFPIFGFLLVVIISFYLRNKIFKKK